MLGKVLHTGNTVVRQLLGNTVLLDKSLTEFTF